MELSLNKAEDPVLLGLEELRDFCGEQGRSQRGRVLERR
jgi:hypothetical protein